MTFRRTRVSRRTFQTTVAAAVAGQTLLAETEAAGFRLNYMLASCMYGYTPLPEIVPEIARTGATSLDIWPKVHGNQREQLTEMGETAFVNLLKQHRVRLGCITQYKLGPFGLADELPLAKRLGCTTIVTGAHGPKGLKGTELRQAVRKFADRMQPHLDAAAENGVTIAIENHSGNILESADGVKWLAELANHQHLRIALAPYHLPQDEKLLADLIRTLGGRLRVFYAWQHGHGCMKKLPKEEELLQMAGRGDLDFRPIVAALQEIRYEGWTEIFMHPVPRGIPILDTTTLVTEEINRSRRYLDECAADV